MPSILSKALTAFSLALAVAAAPQLPGLPAVPAVPAVPDLSGLVGNVANSVPALPGLPASPGGVTQGLTGLIPTKRQTDNLVRDQGILLQIALLVTVDPFDSLANWTEDNDVCSFNGVTCQTNAAGIQVVAVIDLTGFGLAGVDLSLDLFVGLLDLVELHLSANVFIGGIVDFSVLVNLDILDLSYNQLTGGIPDSLLACNLSFLDLRFNLLVGILNVDLFLELDLGVFFIEGNVGITGVIPEFEVGALAQISFANCGLTGEIPVSLSLDVLLTEISFAGNIGITGIIPDAICALPLLVSFDVSGTSVNTVLLGPLCLLALEAGVLII